MRIKTKILLGLLFLFSVSLLLGGLGTFYLRQLANEAKSILDDNYETLEYTRAMQQSLDEMTTSSDNAQDIFEKNLKAQEQNITEIGEAQATAALRSGLEGWKKRPHDPAIHLKLRKTLYQVADLNMQAIVGKHHQVQQTANRVISILTVIESICLILTFTFVVNFPHYIAGPIQTLTQGIKEIANRNYTRRLFFKSGDEFDELAQAFNTMAQKLDEYEHSNLAQIIFEKKRIETIIRQMPDAVIGLNEKKIILFANPTATGLLGMEEQALIGRYAPDVATVNDLMRHLIEDLMPDFQPSSSGGPLKIFANGKESYFLKDSQAVSTTRTAETSLIPIGHVVFLKNITEFRELDAAKTNFIATISHELKTPIASIKMSTQLLEDSRVGSLNDEQQRLTRHIREDAQRLLRITGELLDLTQLETGNIQLYRHPTPPGEIIEYARQALSLPAEQKGVLLEVHVAPNLPLINVDSEKTAWVLTNLLSNAIRYAPEGSKVILSVKSKEQKVEFSVQDFGKGIEPQYQTRVFEKFFRIPGYQEQKSGTGLGLAISKEFILAQNGAMYLESQPGEGSRFGFVLPIATE